MSAQYAYIIPDALDTEQALLYKIAYNGTTGGGGGSGGLTDAQLRASAVPVSLPTGSTTESATAEVASGSVAAGALNVTFLASSDFAGTILGITFAAGATLTRTAPPGKTLGSIAFTRSAGTLNIYKSI